MIQILLLALALAMDAFSVSVSFGICHKDSKIISALRLAFFTGLFQFAMPLLGWLIGSFISSIIVKYSCWISFIIFSGIGIKMIVDAVKLKEECDPIDISRGKHLIAVCIATSIDALVAGFSLGLLKTSLIVSVSAIGIITFLLSFIGVYLGKVAGFFLEKWAEISGGILLIGLGIKVLLFGF